jgi:hypothetical protein
VGIGGLAAATLPSLEAEERGEDSAQKGKIYELQAAFHLAKSTQDIELMMSLWDVNASLTIPGNPNSVWGKRKSAFGGPLLLSLAAWDQGLESEQRLRKLAASSDRMPTTQVVSGTKK